MTYARTYSSASEAFRDAAWSSPVTLPDGRCVGLPIKRGRLRIARDHDGWMDTLRLAALLLPLVLGYLWGMKR